MSKGTVSVALDKIKSVINAQVTSMSSEDYRSVLEDLEDFAKSSLEALNEEEADKEVD